MLEKNNSGKLHREPCRTIELNGFRCKWEFKRSDQLDNEYLPCSSFPTNVHLELLERGLIPDPFFEQNEKDVQDVGETDWTFRTAIQIKRGEIGDSIRRLEFDGLDTFAHVYINQTRILESSNMFTPLTADVTAILHEEEPGEAKLIIKFFSAWRLGKEAMALNPNHKWLCWNGDPSRLAVRKAQYHYGWDWGPKLLTCGPWRNGRIRIGKSLIDDLHVRTRIAADLQSALVTVKLSSTGPSDKAIFVLKHPNGRRGESEVGIKNGKAEFTWRVSNPELWYPRRCGGQPRYELEAHIHLDYQEHDYKCQKFGFRKFELVEDSLLDETGKTFYFKVNNMPVFCGGSNWIPLDSFLPRASLPSSTKYWDMVKLAADGNQNMLRVWGGGIYEDDAFYDACDELGILVWQDFMFACGNYPSSQTFLQSIQNEANTNIKRLRHHPSIIVWAGNNEDYQIMETEKLTYDRDERDPLKWLKSDFPARIIYEKILPEALQAHYPDAIYRCGSPWGGTSTRDPTVGDLHQWNVWHGNQEPYQNYDKLAGRFVSEFGMQAFPSLEAMESFLISNYIGPNRRRQPPLRRPGANFQPHPNHPTWPSPRECCEWYWQSATMDFHNKAADHTTRIAKYMCENLRFDTEPLLKFAYYTQLIQSECISSAFSQWKRKWQGKGREACGGALVWQLNDCWPCVSWSIIDSELRPKLAYYAVKREMAAVTLGMKRIEDSESLTGYRVQVWGSNFGPALTDLELIITSWDIPWNKETPISLWKTVISELEGNQSTELRTVEVDWFLQTSSRTNQTVMGAQLSKGGHIIARQVNWPEPLKYLCLVKIKLEQTCAEENTIKWVGHDVERSRKRGQRDGETPNLDVLWISINPTDKSSKGLRILSHLPIKGLMFVNDDKRISFEDNGLDIIPHDTIHVSVRGCELPTFKDTRVAFLGQAD
ncbi:MAG: hypothetical protein M1814_003821 [Vezdaea aestivalis]|nr:MAG: hypothetical protein M1814_003821 [Vezdaea aestivalis]